jgi:hypothetical protein
VSISSKLAQERSFRTALESPLIGRVGFRPCSLTTTELRMLQIIGTMSDAKRAVIGTLLLPFAIWVAGCGDAPSPTELQDVEPGPELTAQGNRVQITRSSGSRPASEPRGLGPRFPRWYT